MRLDDLTKIDEEQSNNSEDETNNFIEHAEYKIFEFVETLLNEDKGNGVGGTKKVANDIYIHVSPYVVIDIHTKLDMCELCTHRANKLISAFHDKNRQICIRVSYDVHHDSGHGYYNYFCRPCISPEYDKTTLPSKTMLQAPIVCKLEQIPSEEFDVDLIIFSGGYRENPNFTYIQNVIKGNKLKTTSKLGGGNSNNP